LNTGTKGYFEKVFEVDFHVESLVLLLWLVTFILYYT
jgi:hypothetical protein